MRQSISRRGVAASTFDRIAPEAGVSRGSIAWYFGTKERLIAEVMRAETDELLDRLGEHLGAADSSEALIAAAVRFLDDFLDSERGPHIFAQEIVTFAFENGSIGEVQADLRQCWRATLTELLADKADAGVIELIGAPEGTAALITAMGQGIAAEAMADPSWERDEAVRQAIEVFRTLFGGAPPPQR